ncbi:MAG: CobW family GTP-binding protein [Acidimicrobiales bacterium]
MGFLRRSPPAAPPRRDSGAPIPLTVLGGYLGAGKTTLLNRLLADPKGRRLGVIVNDVGEISVDIALVAETDGDTIGLTNGCVCCSLADGFLGALDRLREPGRGIDHVVVEVSGVGDPWKVAQWGRTPGFVLDTVVVLADAETVVSRADDQWVGETVRAQLAGADVVLLTRLDLAEDPDRVIADLTGWMGDVTVAPVVTDAAVIVDGITTPDPARLAALGDARRADGTVAGDGAAGHAHHRVATVEMTTPRLRSEWKTWLGEAPEAVVRVKGFVPVADDEGSTVVELVQLAGRRIEVMAWRGAVPDTTQLVVIATQAIDGLDDWIDRAR